MRKTDGIMDHCILEARQLDHVLHILVLLISFESRAFDWFLLASVSTILV